MSAGSLLERIRARRARTAVVGQGYVGLTVAASAANAGLETVGIDVDAERVRSLSQGRLVVPGVEPAPFLTAFDTGRLTFTNGYGPVADADVVLICVPTPVADHAPDLSYIDAASASIAEVLGPDTLVVLESTTYPGTTEQRVLPALRRSGLEAGRDFHLAYSPERIDPGNTKFSAQTTPRVVAGATAEALELALAFYGLFVDRLVPVSSPRVAELSKLLENTFRHVNIALVNEMAQLCHEMGIDVFEVIDAAATKPFGFLPFYPGPGIGGHCVPLDPTYLAWQVRRDAGRRFGLLELAQDVNGSMPAYVASRVGEALNDLGKPLRGARILVLGVTYKADVGDVRESPSLPTIEALHRRGAAVSIHDPFVEEVALADGTTLRRHEMPDALEPVDLVLLLTPHGTYDLDEIAERAPVVLDARNAYGRSRPANVLPL